MNRSLDFCNAFWGIADGGYDVLLARMRGAARTTEELRAFWKERYTFTFIKLSLCQLGATLQGGYRGRICKEDVKVSEADSGAR